MDLFNEDSSCNGDIEKLLDYLEICDVSKDEIEVCQTLETIVSKLTDPTINESGEVSLLNVEGLKTIFKLLKNSPFYKVKQWCFIALNTAIENNESNRARLNTLTTFETVRGVLCNSNLIHSSQSDALLQNAILFLVNLTANNETGQDLARQSGCLGELLRIYQETFPIFRSPFTNYPANCGTYPNLNTWQFVNNALLNCTSNPENDENQRACSILQPFCYRILQSGNDWLIIKRIATLLHCIMSNNDEVKSSLTSNGGLHVLARTLFKIVTEIDEDVIQDGDEHRDEALLALLNTYISTVTDHAVNATEGLKLGIIKLSLLLLTNAKISAKVKILAVFILSQSALVSDECRAYITGYKNLKRIIGNLWLLANPDLISSTMYLVKLLNDKDKPCQIADNSVKSEPNKNSTMSNNLLASGDNPLITITGSRSTFSSTLSLTNKDLQLDNDATVPKTLYESSTSTNLLTSVSDDEFDLDCGDIIKNLFKNSSPDCSPRRDGTRQGDPIDPSPPDDVPISLIDNGSSHDYHQDECDQQPISQSKFMLNIDEQGSITKSSDCFNFDPKLPSNPFVLEGSPPSRLFEEVSLSQRSNSSSESEGFELSMSNTSGVISGSKTISTSTGSKNLFIQNTAEKFLFGSSSLVTSSAPDQLNPTHSVSVPISGQSFIKEPQVYDKGQIGQKTLRPVLIAPPKLVLTSSQTKAKAEVPVSSTSISTWPSKPSPPEHPQPQPQMKPSKQPQPQIKPVDQSQPQIKPVEQSQPQIKPVEQSQLQIKPPKQPQPQIKTPKQPQQEIKPPKQPQHQIKTPKQPQHQIKTPKQPQPQIKTPKEPQHQIKPPKQPQQEIKPPKQPQHQIKTPKQPQSQIKTPKQPQPQIKTPKQPQHQIKPPKQPQNQIKPPKQPQHQIKPPKQPQPQIKPTERPQPQIKPTERPQPQIKPTEQPQSQLKPTERQQHPIKPPKQPHRQTEPTSTETNSKQRIDHNTKRKKVTSGSLQPGLVSGGSSTINVFKKTKPVSGITCPSRNAKPTGIEPSTSSTHAQKDVSRQLHRGTSSTKTVGSQRSRVKKRKPKMSIVTISISGSKKSTSGHQRTEADKLRRKLQMELAKRDAKEIDVIMMSSDSSSSSYKSASDIMPRTSPRKGVIIPPGPNVQKKLVQVPHSDGGTKTLCAGCNTPEELGIDLVTSQNYKTLLEQRACPYHKAKLESEKAFLKWYHNSQI